MERRAVLLVVVLRGKAAPFEGRTLTWPHLAMAAYFLADHKGAPAVAVPERSWAPSSQEFQIEGYGMSQAEWMIDLGEMRFEGRQGPCEEGFHRAGEAGED